MKKILLLFFCAVSFGQTRLFPKEEMETIVKAIPLPHFGTYSINITQLGAKGDSRTNNKVYFDKAMALCKKNKGGKIIVPQGNYVINGPIHFVSNVNLQLEKGARLLFSEDPNQYLPLVYTSWEGTFIYNYSPMIYGYQCANIAITGEGSIEGAGDTIWSTFKSKEGPAKMKSRQMNHDRTPVKERQFGNNSFLRPPMIQFFNCKQILVENITIKNAPFWCLHLLQSQNVILRGLQYQSHNFNNDGIDIEYTKNVLIENITFDNGDDNIAIKSGRDVEGRDNATTPSENIVIRNCNFKGLHGVVMGSEMSAGIQKVYVENCRTVGYLKRGIYLKTNADRGGFIKNVYFKGIELDQVEDGIYITANYHGEGKGFPSEISDIHFSNISCNAASGTGIVIQGFPEKKVKNITLDTIHIKAAKNAISNTDAENVTINELIIGEKATVPSAVSVK